MPSPAPLLSVIIPTLDEAANLPLVLADLAGQEKVALEVIVGDGGSTDATETIATAAGVRFVRGPRGRGAQMNAAARQAAGRYVLFLHADSRLEDPRMLARALAALREAEHESPWVAGHFRLRFRRGDNRHGLAYRYLEAKTGLNRPGTINGDQGFLLSRAFFERLGGFDAGLPFLEDQRLAERIHAMGRWITLPGVLVTSARRFEREGFHRRYLLMGIMMGMHTIGERDFFRRAPSVYRVQAESGRLLLSPIFGLLWTMARREWGPAGTCRVFARLGRYLRLNGWQVFLWCDVLPRPAPGPARYPLLAWYDRVLAPRLACRWVDGLAGALCFVWYMLVLAGYFRLEEVLVQLWRGRRPAR